MTAKTEIEDGEEKPEITKLEVVDLGEGEGDVDDAEEVQKKRDSGYSYRRPANHALASRTRFQVGQSSGHGGRIVNRHPGQINRPVTKYGPPGYQNSSPTRLTSSHGQQHRDKLQFHGHFGQQHSSNFDGRPGGLPFEQEIPSPIRQVDFVEPNPISTQNDEPFAGHSANYLPPHNQKLPGPSTPQIFAPVHQGQQQQQLANFQNRDVAQGHISDAALFLSQNAQAIQQLYGAPPNEQDFAPNADHQFLGHANQASQLENFEATSQTPQNFPAPLPSYASGTLTAQETLQQIQSLEKDRLIAQLQHALAAQAQPLQNVAADVAGRYAQNQPGFVQNQDLLASIGQRITKFHGLNARPSTVNFGSTGNTAFNQSPFLPGTTVAPGFPLSYGPLSTTVRPSTTAATTTTSTTAATTTTTPQPAKPDATSQVGSSLPAPQVPVYGGFVPFLAGAAFLPNVPASYGPAFLAPGPLTSVHSSTSSPTHFGIPIPTDKPAAGNTPAPPTSPATPSASRPPSPPSLHPVPATPLHPVAPLQPVLPPATHAHPPPTANPGYGLQTAVINPLLYKPVKPVYPFYYYQNVAYQVPKPSALPTYPWSYAPTYAQAKPTQIW